MLFLFSDGKEIRLRKIRLYNISLERTARNKRFCSVIGISAFVTLSSYVTPCCLSVQPLDGRNKDLKKFLIWFGGIAIVLVLLFAFSMVYASFGKTKWDNFSENHARVIVNSLSEMSEEQFNKYWGDNPPGSPEQREKMIKWASGFGVLKTIDKVERVNYMQKVAFSGIHRFYIYDVYATYSNSPIRFRLWFQVHGKDLNVKNMTLNPGTS